MKTYTWPRARRPAQLAVLSLFFFGAAAWAQTGGGQLAARQPPPKPGTEPPASRESSAVTKSAGTTSSGDDDYVIGPLDVVSISVWRESELSRVEPVRPDGKISLPLVGEIRASGMTPRMLQSLIAKELEDYIHKPAVTVIVTEVNSHKFNIIGQVQRPGAYALSPHMTVLDAMAVAGGFRDFAKVRKIYVLRRSPDGSSVRIPFDYKEALKGIGSYLNLEILPGDTVVVP